MDPNRVSPFTIILPFKGSAGVPHDLPRGEKQNLGIGYRTLRSSLNKNIRSQPGWNLLKIICCSTDFATGKKLTRQPQGQPPTKLQVHKRPPLLIDLMPASCLPEKCKLHLLPRWLLCHSASVNQRSQCLEFSPHLCFSFFFWVIPDLVPVVTMGNPYWMEIFPASCLVMVISHEMNLRGRCQQVRGRQMWQTEKLSHVLYLRQL